LYRAEISKKKKLEKYKYTHCWRKHWSVNYVYYLLMKCFQRERKKIKKCCVPKKTKNPSNEKVMSA